MEKVKVYEKVVCIDCHFDLMYKACAELFYSIYEDDDEITIDYCLENIFSEDVDYFDERDYEIIELFDMYEEIKEDFEKYLQEKGLEYDKDLV